MWLYRTSGDATSQIILYEYRSDRKAEHPKAFPKNLLLANTARGAQAGAVMYSLVETAKENGIDPYAYLVWLLKAAAELDLKAHPKAAIRLTPKAFLSR